MANSKNAEKRIRQNNKRRMHNRSIKNTVRTSLKQFEAAVENNDKALAETNYKKFVKLLDTATQKGLFHKNTAARKKSRMNKKLNQL